MTAIQCSMDESFDRKSTGVFSVGSVFARDLSWECLEEKWARILKDNGLTYFRTYECLSVTGEFRKFRAQKDVDDAARKKAWSILDQLSRIVVECRMTMTGLSVDLESFYEVADTTRKLDEFGGSPYYHCYYYGMGLCANVVKGADYRIAFTYDEHQEHGQQLCDAYGKFKELSPEFAPHMSTLAPFDDKLFIPIQVADLVASYVRRYTRWSLSKPKSQIPEGHDVWKDHIDIRIYPKSQLESFLRERGL